ncbi:interferon-inducible protein AIM2 [Acomys russatus]|uniref:interferon-inducible protein AIM2 n=1 Tax=Acomys russatus TaxID=60746 RepID=UPI0021E1F0EA|nr:interferon-inducible protein AIM2 [Acomys russatus]
MESKYKEILLLTGLDKITDEELKRFKFFAVDEFKITRSEMQDANRTDLADQMIKSSDAEFALTKTIRIFRKLNYMHIANCLQEEKKKVESKSMTNPKKKGTQQGKKESQSENHSVVSATRRDKACKKPCATKVCPQAKDLTSSRQAAGHRQSTKSDPQKEQTAAEQEAIREGLQKGPLVAVVLKAMDPFECKAKEGKQEIFHATVATEKEFFFVKVSNAQFKDKFIPRKTIKLSNYIWHSSFLEVTCSSVVVEAESNHKVCVSKKIRKKAGETPKISKLKTQLCGTIVNGIFKVQKITEQKRRVLYSVYDKTGEMEVLVLGNQSKIQCEEGDKLRLTFFEVSKTGEKIQLKSGPYSFFKVIKAAKPKTEKKSVN